MPVRSAPAQNALSPAPVSTTTRTVGVGLGRGDASRSSVITVHDSALRRSGRLIVMVATPSATS